MISPSLVQGSRGYQTMRLSPFISELNPKGYQKSSVQIRSKKDQTKKVSNKQQKSLFQTADELLKKGKSWK